jgi:hypothetical integral membrane protein (TIGR02206 family)
MLGAYFSLAYHGTPFHLLSSAHLTALGFLVILNLLLMRLRGADEHIRDRVRWVLAGTLWLTEISWHVWNIAVGTWTIRSMLPLNLCSIFIWLSGFMLIFRSYRIYEFAYFLGIGAAIQYLATPDLGPYGFPHFRFFEAFTSHGLLLTASVYMTVVEGLRPSWSSLIKVVAWTNVYMGAVFLVNVTIGSDYLMLNAKPATPSLLDLLPRWPQYILCMEIIGIVTCLLLYMPFALRLPSKHTAVTAR